MPVADYPLPAQDSMKWEIQMQLAMIGLGRMGAGIVRRLLKQGHGCIVHDRQPAEVTRLKADGTGGVASPAELVSKMTRPRAIWLMVPAGAVAKALAELVLHLDAGDTVIDGGNSYYRDDIRRARELAAAGLHLVDVGTSGIEYGVMAAYAEGLNILRNANVSKGFQTADAETTPLREPEFYQYELNLPDITEVWRRGSVIGSWLLDLTAGALLRDPQLKAYGGCVSDAGEGRWTLSAMPHEFKGHAEKPTGDPT